MADNSRIEAAAKRLAPYVTPVMDDEAIEDYASALYANEPYVALTWLFGFTTEQTVVPIEVLSEAFMCLNTEDKEDYAFLLDKPLTRN